MLVKRLWSACSSIFGPCKNLALISKILGVLVEVLVGAGNPKLAGIYLQVRRWPSCALSRFSWFVRVFTSISRHSLVKDPEVSQMVNTMQTVLAFAIPGNSGFGHCLNSFSPTNYAPEANCSSLGDLLVNLVLGLVLVLGAEFPL
jgi:hypothetical protein